jgi:putative phage-type endonuclease
MNELETELEILPEKDSTILTLDDIVIFPIKLPTQSVIGKEVNCSEILFMNDLRTIMDKTDFSMMFWDLFEEYYENYGVRQYEVDFVENCLLEVESIVKDFLEITEFSEDIYDLIYECFEDFLSDKGATHRQISPFFYTKKTKNVKKIKRILRNLNKIPQCVQKTPEWYLMRSNLLTATAVSKLFSSQAKTNSVVYEKCLGEVERPPLSIFDARYWGTLYEPVTRQIYECMYSICIKEYGCIQHTEYPFLGASPDGICCGDPTSPKYGRMVEIKNAVNREFSETMCDEYWIQMQIQMEVCNLNVCDYVETRFKEFATAEEYFNACENEMPNFRGIILQFEGLFESKVVHNEYMELDYENNGREEIASWIEEQEQKFKREYKLVKTRYWYLDEINVMVVERNKNWFKHALPVIRGVWEMILKERESGFEHRAPKRRPKKLLSVDFV